LRPGCSTECARRGDVVVGADVPIGHRFGRIHLHPTQCERSLTLAQFGVVDQSLQRALQCLRIIGRYEQRGPVPKFAQAVDVAEHERAARERGIEHGQTRGLVTRGRGINRGVCEPASQLRVAELTEHTHVVETARAFVVRRIAADVHRPG